MVFGDSSGSEQAGCTIIAEPRVKRSHAVDYSRFGLAQVMAYNPRRRSENRGEHMFQRAGTFLAGIFSGLLAAGILFLLISEPRGQPVMLSPAPTPEPLQVYVTGAVRAPGVYALRQGARRQDAILAAGGPNEGALLDGINLASPIQDGEQIHVPLLEETASAQQSDSPLIRTPSIQSRLLNVNTATASELELLPGIGPALAKEIVEYRRLHGPFRRPEDLLAVSGIGPAKLDLIQNLISVP